MSLFKRWCIVLRAYSWPASIVPMVISGVYSYKNGWFNWFDFCLVFFAGLSIHIGANLLNTYYDYRNGVDDESSDDIGIVKGLITPSNAFLLSLLLFSLGAVIGLFIIFKYSLYNLLWICVSGFLLAIIYTANPFSLKYRALGEIVIFLCFGPLIVTGSVMIMAKKFILDSLYLSLPTALLIVNILLANNMRDDSSDSQKGIKTAVDVFGIKAAKNIYLLFLLLSFVIAFFFLNFSMASAVLIIGLFSAYNLFKVLRVADYSALVRETSKFVLIFGFLFSVAIVL
ncbi:MAG: prenyltransferase [Elusimicrobiales bacterium]|nr:prenyltransferase [Elusimicrobiales bacterium]